MSDRYFELNDDVGVTVDGNLEPLAEIGLVVNVPILQAGEVVDNAHRITIAAAGSIAKDAHARIVPGTRIAHCRDPRVADAIAQSGQYHEIDQPTKTDIRSQQSDTHDAREEAGTHKEEGE
jgi:hypothetical protein